MDRQTQTGQAIKSVVILGGGTAGWMTAISLARFFMPGLSVTLIESDDIGTVGVGEASVPVMAQFNAMMGIEEHAFLAATQEPTSWASSFATGRGRAAAISMALAIMARPSTASLRITTG
jgi:tryptophan halogenase